MKRVVLYFIVLSEYLYMINNNNEEVLLKIEIFFLDVVNKVI